jgi:hypothetical protein
MMFAIYDCHIFIVQAKGLNRKALSAGWSLKHGGLHYKDKILHSLAGMEQVKNGPFYYIQKIYHTCKHRLSDLFHNSLMM